jgi:hypothetical protein
VIQFTPPGSGCSVIFGKNVTAAAPGSVQGLYLIVSGIEAARDELLRHGVEISEVFHDAGGVYAGTDKPCLFGRVRISGPDREHRSYRSFASFSDPDGNGWLFQEITTRLPGRIDAATTTFASTNDLASALRRAAAAHGQHEARTGQADPNWPGLVRRVHGARTGWRRAAAMNDYDVIVIGGGAPANTASVRWPKVACVSRLLTLRSFASPLLKSQWWRKLRMYGEVSVYGRPSPADNSL